MLGVVTTNFLHFQVSKGLFMWRLFSPPSRASLHPRGIYMNSGLEMASQPGTLDYARGGVARVPRLNPSHMNSPFLDSSRFDGKKHDDNMSKFKQVAKSPIGVGKGPVVFF